MPIRSDTPLPIHAVASRIVASLRVSNRLVLAAPTGSGKTTQVPQILLGAGRNAGLAPGRIVVLQPRRLATRMVATRVASELGATLGERVGYQTRHDSLISNCTELAFLTEGLFLRQMLGDPTLKGISAVLLDEFHERSVDADLILGLVSQLQRTSRPDLRLLVMSATLDVEGLTRFLDCPAVVAEGRLHPVTTSLMRARSASPVWDLAAEATIEALMLDSQGDVLVFMPGVYEINRTMESIRRTLPATRDVEVRALHGSLPPREQDAALAPSGRQRVIVATNVAETSLTIEGVTTVVDSGLARVHRFEPRRGINTLAVEPISRASAEQRAGRAGRVAPGRCVRLWTASDHAQRTERTPPEIQRLELSEPLLYLKSLGLNSVGVGSAATFPWLDPPTPEALALGQALLERLGAVDSADCLTALGRRMALFPLHPRLGRVLAGAIEHRVLGRAIDWVALAAERDIVDDTPLGRLLSWTEPEEPPSDLTVRANAWREAAQRDFDPRWCQANGLNALACREVARTIEQLKSVARRERLELSVGTFVDLARCVIAGFEDHLAVRLDPARPHCAMQGRRRVTLDERSVVRTATPLVALDQREIGRGDEGNVVLALATAVPAELLSELLPERLTTVVETMWNPASQAVEAIERLCFDGAELRRTARPAGDRTAVRSVLIERILAEELKLERWDEAVEQWIARVRFVATHRPERGLITYDDDHRRIILDEIVGDAVRASQLRERHCLDAVKNALSYDDRRFVERQAPDAIALPRGKRMPIAYSGDGPPIGRARIQELYDLVETPRVCEGRVPVLIEVLGPNHRPVQRTTDLAGFWKTLYPQLRKELKRRYPRHEWR